MTKSVILAVSGRYAVVAGSALLLALAMAPGADSQVRSQPTGATSVLPIFQSQRGRFSTGLAYQLLITPDRTSLGITNNTGTSLDKGATFWLGFLDEQQSLTDVLTFEFSGLIEAGQTLQPITARGVPPASAKFYKLVYWEYAGMRLPQRSITFALTEPSGSGMTYETPDFIITFTIIPQQIGFVLTNRSQSVIRVIWDESAFVDQNAGTHRIIHQGIRFIERDRPMPPTPIPPGAKLTDLLFPTSYVYYVSGSYGGWRQNPLYKDDDTVPFTLGVLVTLEIGPQKRSLKYAFAASRDWPSDVRTIFSR